MYIVENNYPPAKGKARILSYLTGLVLVMRVITFSPIGVKVFCGSDLRHKYKINLASGKHSSVPCLVSGPYPPQRNQNLWWQGGGLDMEMLLKVPQVSLLCSQVYESL